MAVLPTPPLMLYVAKIFMPRRPGQHLEPALAGRAGEVAEPAGELAAGLLLPQRRAARPRSRPWPAARRPGRRGRAIICAANSGSPRCCTWVSWNSPRQSCRPFSSLTARQCSAGSYSDAEELQQVAQLLAPLAQLVQPSPAGESGLIARPRRSTRRCARRIRAAARSAAPAGRPRPGAEAGQRRAPVAGQPGEPGRAQPAGQPPLLRRRAGARWSWNGCSSAGLADTRPSAMS